MRLIIVTGMSGAGKSTAIRFLEDIGYYVVDNMPPAFVSSFAHLCNSTGGKLSKAAIVCDSRVGDFFSDLKDTLLTLKENNISYEVLFLEADDLTLIKRYKETRRKHPLQEGKSLPDAINEERKMLKEIRETAHIVDTTDSTGRQLVEQLRDLFLGETTKSQLKIDVVSFGFKYGAPLDADLVFDVRFLPNPFYIPELKKHNGTEPEVSEYVMSFKEAKVFYEKLIDMVKYLVPLYIEDGRAGLVIAIGCTGGQHRSVTIAEKLYKDLKINYNVDIIHRDCEKNTKSL